MQLTSGLRAVLSHPGIYQLFQRLTGAERLVRCLAAEHIRAQPGEVVLDVGCGPADVLRWLPEGVEYYGVDISQEYLRVAERRWRGRGRFYCRSAAELTSAGVPRCDIALALGVMHHLDDDELLSMLRQIRNQLKPGGRFVSYDPCFTEPQNPLARLVHRLDRGRNVRYAPALAELVGRVFPGARWRVRTDLCRIPASAVICEALKPPAEPLPLAGVGSFVVQPLRQGGSGEVGSS